jgi:tRNA(Arg) A34 adenosine deaminase TadA
MNYLDLATRIAKANASRDKHFSFGCVSIREDGAIIVASNIRTRDPIVSAHAESRAIRKSGYGATLYVVRIDRRGQWGLARPCVECQSLIRNHNVRRVYYSVSPETYAVWNVQCPPISASAMLSRKSKLGKLSV